MLRILLVYVYSFCVRLFVLKFVGLIYNFIYSYHAFTRKFQEMVYVSSSINDALSHIPHRQLYHTYSDWQDAHPIAAHSLNFKNSIKVHRLNFPFIVSNVPFPLTDEKGTLYVSMN